MGISGKGLKTSLTFKKWGWIQVIPLLTNILGSYLRSSGICLILIKISHRFIMNQLGLTSS